MADWKYEIGDRIIDEKRNLEIIDREIRIIKRKYMEHHKWYKYKCHNCGYDEGWIYQSNLVHSKRGCSVCGNKTVLKGVNDIATLYPEKVKYFLNPQEADLYSPFSRHIIKSICPNCGDTREIPIQDLISNELYPCYRCGDGISAPEKFIYALLRECNINFIRQLSKKHFKWCGKYRYDFYLIDYKIIIEVHGNQHYDNKISFGTCDYEEIHKNDYDKIMNILNNQNGDVKNLVVIDASKTTKEYLINSIKNSELFSLLNINQDTIDFDKCFSYVHKSNAVEISNYYNDHQDMTITEIGEYFGVDRHSVARYLRQGNDMGICNYNFKERSIKHAKNIGKNNSKKVNIVTPDGMIYSFNSAKEASDKSMELFGIHLHQSDINACCRGVYKTTKGFKCFREKGGNNNE